MRLLYHHIRIYAIHKMQNGQKNKAIAGFAGFRVSNSRADEAVHWCNMMGVVNGKQGKRFDPQGTATRVEAATMVQRFCKALEN